MNRKLILTAAISLTAMAALFAETKPKPDNKPKGGYVPDAATAIKIAVAVWTPMYGEEQIASEKPYRATLSNGVWFVEGSLTTNYVGGVAEAEIARDDGRILRVIHGQ